MKNTKIICTLGPSSASVETLKQMVQQGMNVARINFSHGTQSNYVQMVQNVLQVRSQLGVPVAIMFDTKGPEVRIKTFENGVTTLKQGQPFSFTTRQVKGNASIVSVTHESLHRDLAVGDVILVNDGLMSFKVQSIVGSEINCVCQTSGTLSDYKGMHFPESKLSLPFLSDADRRDLEFAHEHNADFIAVSFVSSAKDILEIKDYLKLLGNTTVRLIAKIENQTGVDNLSEILTVADGVMVARGDLGVSIPFTKLPSLQKHIIRCAQSAGKEVIVATEMLESMVRNPRPTRAEISDVANAVYDQTSAVMLSAETAVGLFAVSAVKTMNDICLYVESALDYEASFAQKQAKGRSVTEDICYSACASAHALNAKAVVVSTKSGKTARAVAKFMPKAPIIAFVLDDKTYQQLSLTFGVLPVLAQGVDTLDELLNQVQTTCKKLLALQQNDLVVVTAGYPLGEKGSTNLIQIVKIK